MVAGADPIQAIDRGYANMIKPGGSSTWGRGVPGATPFTSSAFTTAFKIYKTIKKIIKPGEEYRLVFKGPSYKTINYARYWNVTTGAAMVDGEPDKFRAIILQARGTPVNAGTVKTQVGISEVALDWTMFEKIELGFNMFQNYKQYYYSTQSGNFVTMATAPLTVVEATGAGVLVANA